MKITETPNTKAKLDIRKMAMSCDDNGHEVPPPLQKGNFFYIVVGQPSSGKTNLWLNFIKKRKCFYHKQFHKIYIFSNSLHTIKEKINLPKEQLIHGFDLERLRGVLSPAGRGRGRRLEPGLAAGVGGLGHRQRPPGGRPPGQPVLQSALLRRVGDPWGFALLSLSPRPSRSPARRACKR